MGLRNCIKDINFANPFQMRRVHRDLMNELSSEAQYISKKYNVQINPLYLSGTSLYPW